MTTRDFIGEAYMNSKFVRPHPPQDSGGVGGGGIELSYSRRILFSFDLL